MVAVLAAKERSEERVARKGMGNSEGQASLLTPGSYPFSPDP
jgi:hypothetical protein